MVKEDRSQNSKIIQDQPESEIVENCIFLNAVNITGAEGVAQRLSTHTALSKDLSSAPNLHWFIQEVMTSCNFSSRNSDALFWPLQRHMHSCTHTPHTYAYNLKWIFYSHSVQNQYTTKVLKRNKTQANILDTKHWEENTEIYGWLWQMKAQQSCREYLKWKVIRKLD